MGLVFSVGSLPLVPTQLLLKAACLQDQLLSHVIHKTVLTSLINIALSDAKQYINKKKHRKMEPYKPTCLNIIFCREH